MRAWLPDTRITGPERATERDIEGLNRVFAEAFTDRYRRDGLIGVRVPQLNPLVWRYALLDAGEGAMVWRDEHDNIAAFNVAHHAGREGWMGPLAVRPDRQGSGAVALVPPRRCREGSDDGRRARPGRRARSRRRFHARDSAHRGARSGR